MEESLLQLSAGGIFALLLLREVFGFINKRGNKDLACKLTYEKIEKFERLLRENHLILKESDELLDEMREKLKDLHNWHNTEDPETGIKIWYVNSMKTSLKEIKNLIMNRNGPEGRQ